MLAQVYDQSMEKDDSNELVTKGFLRAELRGEINSLEFRMDSKIDTKIGDLRNDLVSWKDEILTQNDKLIKKLDTWLTERDAIHGNYQQLEGRVRKLELARGAST